jgi:protein YIPF6
MLSSIDFLSHFSMFFLYLRVLQGSSEDTNHNDGGPEFAEVFVIVWIGAMVVTLNSKLLGGNM